MRPTWGDWGGHQGGHMRTSRGYRPVALIVVITIVGLSLSACGSSSSSGATPTINLYLYPDNSGAAQKAVDNCNAASNGAYNIKYQVLPKGADGQRQQMVRRLA